MAVKESTIGQASAIVSAEQVIKRVAKTRAMSYLGLSAIGFLLARAFILGGISPFAAAFVASQCTVGTNAMPGKSGTGDRERIQKAVFALSGVIGGYLTVGLGSSIRYMAVCILIFSASMVFRGSSLSKKVFFAPAVALLMSGATGIVYWASIGAETLPLVLLITELLLIAGCSYLFSAASDNDIFAEQTQMTNAGRLLIASCCLMALSGIELGTLSPARIIAVCAVMLIAFRGGTGMGAGTGLSMGLVMDLGLGFPYYSMAYGSAGLSAGLFRRAGKLFCALAFVGTGAVTALWAVSNTQRLSVMLEYFIASVIFLVIPDMKFPKLTFGVARTDSVAHTERLRAHIREHLTAAGQAFENIHEEVVQSLERSNRIEGIEVVFDRTSKQICQRCAQVRRCWEEERRLTYSSIRSAAALCEKRGWIERSDFPTAFSCRCPHYKQFVETANREMGSMLSRRQFGARVSESRAQLSRQYAEFGRVLTEASERFDLRFDNAAERRLARFLQRKQLSAATEVYALPNGRMCAKITGENLSVLLTDKRMFALEVSNELGWLANEPDVLPNVSLNQITLFEAEPMTVTLGVAAHKRDGQAISGDTGTYFKNDEGMLFIILSDGMGSGEQAAYDSRQAVTLLEKLLKANISPECALGTLNSALCLKNADTSVFVTIDLLALDLLTGQLSTYKLGAAPTYIRQNGMLRRLGNTTLPAGLDAEYKPQASRARLDDGDWVFLITDGIADGENDGWLLHTLNKIDEADSPRDCAARVLNQAMQTGGAADDMTVLAIKTRLNQT
jgi:stage II sporulation protein E